MFLYNSIMGVNPLSKLVLLSLNIIEKFPDKGSFDEIRFRDAQVIKDEHEFRFLILTRTGGGNMASYQDEIDKLHTLNGFVKSYECEEDNTYMCFEYSIQDHMLDTINGFYREFEDAGIAEDIFDPPMVRYMRKIDSFGG